MSHEGAGNTVPVIRSSTKTAGGRTMPVFRSGTKKAGITMPVIPRVLVCATSLARTRHCAEELRLEVLALRAA